MEVSKFDALAPVTPNSTTPVNDSVLHQLTERIAALEARLAALEQPVSSGRVRITAPARRELDELTWAMIAAVVAMVYPSGRIHAINAVMPVGMEPVWGIEGRRDIFYSHRVR